MSDRFQTDTFEGRPLTLAATGSPLPPWLAGRLLRDGETVTWVYGPRLNPPWERYVTHPGLFLFAVALGVFCFAAGSLIVGGQLEAKAAMALAGGAIVLASVFVLGIANGYFTRLVVTDSRLVVLQGYEVCRSWGLDRLPRSLIRYRMMEGGVESRSVDLDALKTMLGTASDKFAESKTILAFTQQLDRIKPRED